MREPVCSLCANTLVMLFAAFIFVFGCHFKEIALAVNWVGNEERKHGRGRTAESTRMMRYILIQYE